MPAAPVSNQGPTAVTTLSWWDRWRRWWRGEVAPELGDPLRLRGFDARSAWPNAPTLATPYQPVRMVRSAQEIGALAVPAPMEAPTFQIQCLPLAGAVEIGERIKQECERRAAGGLRLTSTFQHDGHAFLVFKRN